MAASAGVIKEFLVSLGFSIDQAGYKNFNNALGGTSKMAFDLGKQITQVGIAAHAMTTLFAFQMEKLYYASKRTQSSVESLQALEYGARRIGLSAGTAQEALESMVASVRMNPGLRSLMDMFLGKSTAGMDQSRVMLELVDKLSKMPHYVGARFAAMFGMDEKTFLMLKEGLPELIKAEKERRDLNKQAGIDAEKAAEAAKDYANGIRDITSRLGLLKDKLSIELLPSFKDFNRALVGFLDNLLKIKASDLLRWFKTGSGEGFTISQDEADEEGNPRVASSRESSGVIKSSNTPLGLRQNNPGNLRSWGGATVQNGFAKFRSMGEGLSAMAGNLLSYGRRGLNSVKDIVSRWAPNNENDTGSYIAAVAKQLGVHASQSLNLNDPKVLSSLMGAMIKHEQGFNPFGSGELLAAANARLGNNGRSVVIHQKTDIHVNGGDSPAATGAAIGREQSRVNADLTRNMQGAIS